jgi:queuine tRNA-ribosyltransferase
MIPVYIHAFNQTISMLCSANGIIETPAFLPDATRGFVRCVDHNDLMNCGVKGLVMNVFHLMRKPGRTTIKALGGLHAMYNWKGPIFTDSGGFQAYSIIRENNKYGYISDNGINFRDERTQKLIKLTPEKCIRYQLQFGTDVAICLDECTHINDPYETQEKSVNRTIQWAIRCKEEFLRRVNTKKSDGSKKKQLLFAVIQGGGVLELRMKCITSLLEIGFDGFGFGGWPFNSSGELLLDILDFTRKNIPRQYPVHALGVGHPYHIAQCLQHGYSLFDSALPTRDARDGRLYCWKFSLSELKKKIEYNNWMSRVYIHDKKYLKDRTPISPSCDCFTCSNYSRGFLHHLYKTKDDLYRRLATIHNLRFINTLIDIIICQN